MTSRPMSALAASTPLAMAGLAPTRAFFSGTTVGDFSSGCAVSMVSLLGSESSSVQGDDGNQRWHMVQCDYVWSWFCHFLRSRVVMAFGAQWPAVNGALCTASRGQYSRRDGHSGHGRQSDGLYEYRGSTTSRNSCDGRRSCDAELGHPSQQQAGAQQMME